MRLIRVIKLADGHETGRAVKVYDNNEWDEFVCQLWVSGKHYEPADYHSDDKQDAINTAHEMCKRPEVAQ